MFLTAIAVLSAPHFRLIQIDPGSGFSDALAVNDRGTVVGYRGNPSINPSSSSRAFIFRDGKLRELGPFEGQSRAVAVNSREQILVQVESASADARHSAILVQGANSRRLPVAGPPPFEAKGLGGDGTVVGTIGRFGFRLRRGHVSRFAPWRQGETFESHCRLEAVNYGGWAAGACDFGTELTHPIVVRANGSILDLHPRVALHEGWTATAINRRGDVAGIRYVDFSVGGSLPILWKDGQEIELESVAGRIWRSEGINDSDEVVGRGPEPQDGPRSREMAHGQLWRGGVRIDLNDVTEKPADVTIVDAHAINNRGDIAGMALADRPRGRHYTAVILIRQ